MLRLFRVACLNEWNLTLKLPGQCAEPVAAQAALFAANQVLPYFAVILVLW